MPKSYENLTYRNVRTGVTTQCRFNQRVIIAETKSEFGDTIEVVGVKTYFHEVVMIQGELRLTTHKDE